MNEDAKLLKSSGYEDFLNDTKRDTKKVKSSNGDESNGEKKFNVKFDKRPKSNKPAKFLKFSNKKSNH